MMAPVPSTRCIALGLYLATAGPAPGQGPASQLQLEITGGKLHAMVSLSLQARLQATLQARLQRCAHH